MNSLARAMFPEKAAQFDAGICTNCACDAHHAPLRDEKSKAEYQLSGMCQTCQDEFFK